MNELTGLIEEGFDVAIRIALDLPDSDLVVRRFAADSRVVAASPTCFERYGSPDTPEDLRARRCLMDTLYGSKWRFKSASGELAVQVSGPLASNNGFALRSAAARGMGVAGRSPSSDHRLDPHAT